MVASLMAGERTCCAQPCISATLAFRAPMAGKTCGLSTGEGAAIVFGTIWNRLPKRPGRKRPTGFATQAPISARRNSQGRGSTVASIERISRSRSGRS